MLLEFSTTNYRSIGDKQTLSLLPANSQKEHLENIFKDGPYAALNAVAFYGANASGKTNLLRALSVMHMIIFRSARTSSATHLPYDPFLLREGYNKEPTAFEIMFVLDSKRYRYGFSYNETAIVKEWLYRKSKGREVCLFVREEDVIDVQTGYDVNKKMIDMVIDATRSNALFLSVCDMFNTEEARRIVSWFHSIYIVNGLETEELNVSTFDLWQKPFFREKINSYLKNFCLGVDALVMDVDVTDSDKQNENKNKTDKMPQILACHRFYNKEGDPTDIKIKWDWEERESEGSKKALHLSGPVLWAISTGGILVIDEIEAKLHPIMTLNTIDIFLDPRSNPNRAQLIFATHDTNILSYAKLRRDQIYFAEKNKWESTELFSLSDFVYYREKNGQTIEEKERRDSDKERRYIEGRYGAIPALGNFKSFINNIQWQNEEN